MLCLHISCSSGPKNESSRRDVRTAKTSSETQPPGRENPEVHSADIPPPNLKVPPFRFEYFDINHILSTGQSNSIGTGSAKALSLSQPFQNLMFNVGVSTLNMNGSINGELRQFVPLSEGTWGQPFETISSGLANLVTELAQQEVFTNEPSPRNTHQVLMSVNGIAGLAYSDLKKGKPAFSRASDPTGSIASAQKIATNQGNTFVVRALTVIHGEADHQAKNPNYTENLFEWQRDYETTVKDITKQTQNVPMLMSQMSSFPSKNYESTMGVQDPHSASIPLQQLAAHVSSSGRIVLVGPTYQLPFAAADHIHFTEAGYQHLGEYFAKVYRSIVLTGHRWDPLRPVSATLNGNVIDIKFLVPKAPLAWDTVIVPKRDNYGFSFADDGAPASEAAIITRVDLASSDTVRITLSRNPLGTKPRISYAVDPNHGSGNLRDSDDTKSRNGYPLQNWAVHFSLDLPYAEEHYTPAIPSRSIKGVTQANGYHCPNSGRVFYDYNNVATKPGTLLMHDVIHPLMNYKRLGVDALLPRARVDYANAKAVKINVPACSNDNTPIVGRICPSDEYRLTGRQMADGTIYAISRLPTGAAQGQSATSFNLFLLKSTDSGLTFNVVRSNKSSGAIFDKPVGYQYIDAVLNVDPCSRSDVTANDGPDDHLRYQLAFECATADRAHGTCQAESDNLADPNSWTIYNDGKPALLPAQDPGIKVTPGYPTMLWAGDPSKTNAVFIGQIVNDQSSATVAMTTSLKYPQYFPLPQSTSFNTYGRYDNNTPTLSVLASARSDAENIQYDKSRPSTFAQRADHAVTDWRHEGDLNIIAYIGGNNWFPISGKNGGVWYGGFKAAYSRELASSEASYTDVTDLSPESPLSIPYLNDSGDHSQNNGLLLVAGQTFMVIDGRLKVFVLQAGPKDCLCYEVRLADLIESPL